VLERNLIKIRDTRLTWPLQRIVRRFGLSINSNVSDLEGQLSILIKQRDLRYCIDVGAHQGEFIDKLARLGFTLDFLAIEPSPISAAKLRNRKLDNVRLIECGLGAQSGITNLYENGSVFASVKKRIDGNEVSQFTNVNICRLDELLKEVVNFELSKTLLKIDTQGSELDILEGAGESLLHFPVVLVEVPLNALYENSFNITEIVHFMSERSFLIGAVHTPRFNNGRPYDCDMIFIKNLC